MAEPTPPLPDLLTLLVCEKAIRDGATGQVSIIGILSHVTCSSFPARLPAFVVFMEFTGGHGPFPVKIRIADADDQHPAICEVEAGMQMHSPLVVVQIPFVVTNVSFPSPGQYRVQVYAHGTLLRERRITLVPAPPMPTMPPAPPPDAGPL